MHRNVPGLTIILLAIVAATARADAPDLYGIHYWGYSGSLPADPSPGQLLDVSHQGGWDVEVANTTSNTDVWWTPAWFQPFYQQLYNQHVSIITRLNYNWGETLPRPTLAGGAPNPDYTNFASSFVSSVNALSPYSHLWQLGNEPNLDGEGAGWPNSQIDPVHYAQVYQQVHAALVSSHPSPAGPNELLVAPPSPGGAVPGVRWMDGATWLSQVLSHIPHNEVDGIALHAYGVTLGDFRLGLLQQIQAIDQAGFGDKPLYLNEWNRYADPNSASDEAASAQFVRDVYQFLNRWNQTAGNHNIVEASWFAYDADNQSANQWNGYSIEYWKTHGNPPGSPGDLYTAFQQTVQLRYPAGVAGTRAIPPTLHVLDNFEQDNGHFNSPLSSSPTTHGINPSLSSAARDINDSLSLFASQKLMIADGSGTSGGWRVRHLYNGGNPSSPATEHVPLAGNPDEWVGFYLRTSSPDLTVQMAFDPNGLNTPDPTIATTALPVVGDGQWRLYEWSVANASNFIPFPGTNGTGILPASGYLTIDSILFNSATDQSATMWLDAVAFNTRGDLNNLPEPTLAGAMLLVPWLRRRRSGVRGV